MLREIFIFIPPLSIVHETSAYSSLKRNSLHQHSQKKEMSSSKPKISDASSDNLFAVFKFFDYNHRGVLDRCEVTAALVQFFPLVSPSSIANSVSAAATNKFGNIDFDEFRAVAAGCCGGSGFSNGNDKNEVVPAYIEVPVTDANENVKEEDLI